MVFSAPLLPGWADDESEEENGRGEIIATITEISNFWKKLGQSGLTLGEKFKERNKKKKVKWWGNWSQVNDKPKDDPTRKEETQTHVT